MNDAGSKTATPFLTDIVTVTAAYAAERDTVVKLLNDVLATELVCMLRAAEDKKRAGRSLPSLVARSLSNRCCYRTE